jgi:glycosyltransferase involved in cell wall biosynthesis
LRRELGLVEDDTVILAVGRLSKEKGHVDLLQALSVVRRDIPEVNWKLVLVGTGPEQAELDRLSAKLGLTDRVVMAGFRPTVASFFAIAGLFVLPSHSEGSSNVLLEAMAARLPIVATRAGGTPEIAEDEKTALLVDSRNAMANAVRRFLTDGALRVRLADAAYAHAIAEFSPDRYRASLVTIYQDALSMAQSQAIPLSSTG